VLWKGAVKVLSSPTATATEVATLDPSEILASYGEEIPRSSNAKAHDISDVEDLVSDEHMTVHDSSSESVTGSSEFDLFAPRAKGGGGAAGGSQGEGGGVGGGGVVSLQFLDSSKLVFVRVYEDGRKVHGKMEAGPQGFAVAKFGKEVVGTEMPNALLPFVGEGMPKAKVKAKAKAKANAKAKAKAKSKGKGKGKGKGSRKAKAKAKQAAKDQEEGEEQEEDAEEDVEDEEEEEEEEEEELAVEARAKVIYGCGRCRNARKGCSSCQKWATAETRGYKYSESMDVLAPGR